MRSPDSGRHDARARLEGERGSPALRAVPAARLRVADVALLYGERGGAIRTYVDARAAWATATGAIEHHLIVPGTDGGAPGRHELPSLRLAPSDGFRVPRGAASLLATLRTLRPDVVLLHDPLWAPHAVARTAREIGATTLAVHHGSVGLCSAGLPGPDCLWQPALRAWMRHAYGEADAVVSAVDPRADCGRPAAFALRFGLDPAFVPQPRVRRQDHVLYVGRLAREKGVAELLHAAARLREPWQLHIAGHGPAERRLRRLADRLGLGARVRWLPFVAEPAELARAYAAARVVVMPGAHETFGLLGFEAAACGASVVTCSTAPAARQMRRLVRMYAPGDVDGLRRAIEAARASDPDPVAAGALAARSTWAAVFEAELVQLTRLAGGASQPRNRGTLRSLSSAQPWRR
ncbi:MAG: hypothetical protein QOE31_113 [Solirubrobacteraceae bacterium]|nr:hypothetical protein [Solirubrobacteraceae bacterium]